MTRYNAPFEIHVHGDVPLREDVVYGQIQDALKPLWQYAGARSLAAAAESAYEDEPGISTPRRTCSRSAGRCLAMKTSGR
jgi:hypothetical protein